MKEMFGITPSSDDDDAVMGGFLNYANNLKNEIEKLEIHYKNQPLYPGKAFIQQGKKLMTDVLQMKNANEFFAAVDRDRDNFLDFAEDFEPVRKFFGGDQITIFDRAIRLMAIYDDSRTFIVNDEIESTVAQVKAIMKKPAPYSDIFKLPGLLDTYISAYSALLTEMEKPILAAFDEARARVMNELEGKFCKDALRQKILDRFNELYDKATHCNNVATLQNIKVEADALKVRCLNEIAAAENKILAEKAAEEARKQAQQKKDQENTGGNTPTPVVPTPAPAPKVKTQRTVSIKTINTETTWQLETADDVKKYVAELERKLLAQLDEDTVLHVEF